MYRVMMALLVCFCVVTVYGATASNEYLRIGVGERAVSMGEAFTGVSNDATTLYWNPAGATQLDSKALSLGYTEFVADIKLSNIAYTVPMKNFVVGVGVQNLFTEDLRRDEDGNVQGTFVNNLTNVGVMLAHQFSNGLSVGATVKGLQEQLDTYRASGIALDLGVMKSVGGMNIGLTVKNIGTSENGALPTDVRLGIGYSGISNMTIASDIEFPMYGQRTIMVGGEYNVYKSLYLRGGYKYRDGGSQLGSLDGINAGLGFSLGKNVVNYAISPFGEFAVIHRLSFNRYF